MKGNSKFYYIQGNMVDLSEYLGVGEFGLKCSQKSWKLWQGGNQWSGWVSYLSFFRHVAKLKIDYTRFSHWEDAAIYGGPRIMHKDFCIVSDFPTKLEVNSNNRPHCETGAFCEWSDGSKIYMLNGVQVPGGLLERGRDNVTVQEILDIKNVEKRAELIKWVGVERFFEKLNPRLLDRDGDYELYSVPLYEDMPRVYLKMQNPSVEEVHLEAVHPDCVGVKQALHWRNFGDTNLPETGFEQPMILT